MSLMRIDSGFGYMNFLQKTSQQMNRIPGISIKESATDAQKRAQEEQSKSYQLDVDLSADKEQPERNKIQNASIEDVTLSLASSDDLEFLGRDSDLFGLDLEKAVSDMKKDDVLKDYQYFVGRESQIREIFSDEDGSVFLKGVTGQGA